MFYALDTGAIQVLIITEHLGVAGFLSLNSLNKTGHSNTTTGYLVKCLISIHEHAFTVTYCKMHFHFAPAFGFCNIY